MLVLTRRKDDRILIDDNIEITIVDVVENRVKIGIDAPKNIRIIRKEVLDIMNENIESLGTSNIDAIKKLKEIKKK